MKDKTPTILVTGANGQLGAAFKSIAPGQPLFRFLFVSKEELPIDDHAGVKKYFTQHAIDFCINCAAYTAVDIAETEKEKAFAINGIAVGNLALVCKSHLVKLIHISTDYVFDGTSGNPYKETDPTSPVNIYGASKLKGEELAMQNNSATIIIRSSWLYSLYGHNFVKTMLKLMREKESINVVNDQFGCPTNATDLANAIMQIILQLPIANCPLPVVLNYSNTGITTWFGFATTIKDLTGSKCIINPVPTSQYPTAAKRPQYSVLGTSKIQEFFQISIPNWKDSLQKCLESIK